MQTLDPWQKMLVLCRVYSLLDHHAIEKQDAPGTPSASLSSNCAQDRETRFDADHAIQKVRTNHRSHNWPF
jgi:hypothetical protein